jgi:methyltransferase (TIGR00027 family)
VLTVSDTAYTVAAIRALEVERPVSERLFDDPYASLFQAAGAHAAEATARMIGLPFMVDGVRLRTRFIDDTVREGLAAGLRQIVLFGAGLDMRALRVREIASSGARVYEVDLPGLLGTKRDILKAAGVAVPPHVAHFACDFMDPAFEPALLASMQAGGFRAGAGALFVWEGILPYIDDPAIDRSLGFMARAGAARTRVVFDYADGHFTRGSAEDRVRQAGFTTFRSTGQEVLWREHLPGEPHPAAAMVRMGVAGVDG